MTDPTADQGWDAFVSAAANGSYMQLSSWAAVKAVNGWAAVRLRGEPADTVGGQVLVRRVAPLPWSIGYAPRAPVLTSIIVDWVPVFTKAVRDHLGGRVCEVAIDPEIEVDGPVGHEAPVRAALQAAGWTPRPPVQPDRSRLVDLAVGEDDLWAGLRSKWRQYVNGARRAGVTVEESDATGVAAFYDIYRETARRAGFIIRAESTYRDVWRLFDAEGRARLLLARLPDGTPAAALMLLRCGGRVVEPYGGMTEAGAHTRANYLLKWEAMRSSQAAGARVYDMWGLSHPGIAHFKAGFGGREVRYIGAYRLVLDGIGSRAIEVAQRANTWLARRRHGLSGSAPE
jgi:lipid II:glycine glycyltransferase (peptidoglycan interpeptide bridge formation enzyme)